MAATRPSTAGSEESGSEESVSEGRFRVAFEHAPLAMGLIDLHGRYALANRAMCELLGYSEEQLRALTFADITHPGDLGADRVAMRRLLAGETMTVTVEKRYITAAGATVVADRSAWLVRRPDGTPLHLVVLIQDVSERREHELALAEERRRLHEAQTIGGVGSWTRDVATSVTTWSDTLYALYGLDPATFTVSPEAALGCIHPDDRVRVATALGACITNGRSDHARYRVARPDGELRWMEGRVEPVFEDGRLVRIGGAVIDVTEVIAEADVRAAHAFQQAVISASPDMILVYDLTVRSTVWTNRSLSDVVGYAPAATGGTGLLIEGLIPEADRPRWEAALDSAAGAADDEIISLNHRLMFADGILRSFSLRLTPFRRDDGGRVTQLVGVLRDTTAALALEERLAHAAGHDDLTGLPNRRLVTDRLALALQSDAGGAVVVLFCDLDGFKRVNDSQGHHAGDAVLVETAARMTEALRPGDTIGRMGGDEFVVVCAAPPGWDAGALADTVARRIEQAVVDPITVDGSDHRITISIGIYLAAPGDDADVALRNADRAMYLAKTCGKNGHAVFTASPGAERPDRDCIEHHIRRALDEDTVEVHYQPIVEPGTGRVRVVEALLRVPDGAGGYLDTLEAVQVAEHTGLVSAVDQRVLRVACLQVAAWRREPGHADLVLAVNRSAADIARPGFYDRITDTVAATGLRPAALTVEITETVLLKLTEQTITDLRRLRAAGIGIAIDDFGTGYASLRYLATLPIGCLKVDRSFTAGLPDDPACTTIVRATVGLAADLGMSCIVEGVETAAQLGALAANPALLVQGYLYSPPLPGAAGLPTHLPPRLALPPPVATGQGPPDATPGPVRRWRPRAGILAGSSATEGDSSA